MSRRSGIITTLACQTTRSTRSGKNFMLTGFFNDRFIAPLITPSRSVSSTPIIVDPNSTAISKDPLIIIPKINVQIPVIYNEPSVNENAIQKSLDQGVVHYATTPYPG